ncbi:glycosyltransferase family 4 protein [Sutcliffiella horikoshii]|uniref:glycosyltransferase family 4 protein n=1 Tax=Sutcliffiella horikoshii TaxID=79883 RepID=UPI001F18C595|nr:glycosyltransferase family 4 protein [Sutcliffiella horikoshii]
MRIVHFDQMFHPEFGDQINILPKIQAKLGYEVFIITGSADVPHPRFIDFADNTNMDQKDKVYEEATGVKIVRIGVKRFISGRAIFESGYKDIIDQLQPDILFCHFNDTLVGMHYTLISKKLNYPVIFDSHMLDIASKNKFKKLFRLAYRTILTPTIKKNNLIIIRTQDDDYVNKELGIPKKLTPFISFGSDTTLFHPNLNERNFFREKHNLKEDDFVVLYTGKLNEDKGINILAEAFKDKFNSKRDITLVLVGNGLKEYEDYLFKSFLQRSPNKIIRYQTQKYVDLPRFYQMADVCVFPKQCSLSFYDAQACGLPVIAEQNKINMDRLSYKNGELYKENSVKDLREKITNLANLNKNIYSTYKENSVEFIKNNYDYIKITKEYNSLIQAEYKRFHSRKKD